jgi:hypothetical protein
MKMKDTIINGKPEDMAKIKIYINRGWLDHKVNDYNDWRDVGFAIHSTDNTENGLDLFDLFSQRSEEKYDVDEVKKQWGKFNNSCSKPITMGSIELWVKEGKLLQINKNQSEPEDDDDDEDEEEEEEDDDDDDDDDEDDEDTGENDPENYEDKETSNYCFLTEFYNKWNLSEASFARSFQEICFQKNPVMFTGISKDMEGFMLNGIY